MPLNLISDAWIPVRTKDGLRVIRPDEIADPGVLALAWPRPDFNLACLELLIGLVYLAAPPADRAGWRARKPDQGALRQAMEPLAEAFELTGDGPLFLQDFEPLVGEASPPDMLFIDSAGEQTIKKNADLMVKRARFETLDLPKAAMALYTLQAFAPAGGAGNRTSMRGGGPLVTLAKPGTAGLWPLVWANVPEGVPVQDLTVLPWMRPTVTSEGNRQVAWPEGRFVPAEVFFGQPRRLRLVIKDERVTGVVQRPYGTNYAGWPHPLSPYYALKEGAERLPQHPRPGVQTYRNWMGVSLRERPGKGRIAWRAKAVEDYLTRRGDLDRGASILAGGWAMSNMSPLDFVYSEQPLMAFDEEASDRAAGLVEAANLSAQALMRALTVALGLEKAEGTPVDPAREAFFMATEPAFRKALAALPETAAPEAEKAWRDVLRRQALAQFDALPAPVDLPVVGPDDPAPFSRRPTMRAIVRARQDLLKFFNGKALKAALGLDILEDIPA